MSNQVTGISIKSNYRCSTTVFRNAVAIQDKVRDKLKDKSKKYFILQFMPLPAPALVDSIVFYINGLYRNPESKKLADVMGYTYGKEKLLSITNLTRLDISQQYGSYEMKNAVFVPPVVSYGKRIIGVLSDDGGMNIIYHFMDDQEEAGERAFFEAANANLRSFLCC